MPPQPPLRRLRRHLHPPGALALLAGVLVVAVVARPAAAAGAKLPDPNAAGLSASQRVAALVARVQIEQKKVKTLQADFVQRQESSMLVEPDTSRGVLSYRAPESVRWEYSSPKPISVVIDGEQMTTWYRDLGRAERLKVGKYSNQVLKYLGATGSFDTLLDYFEVRVLFPDDRKAPYRIELVPRYERIKRRLAGMSIWIDPVRYLPVKMRYEAADGDVTEYEFHDLRVNTEIPAARFRLDLPKGVEVEEVSLERQG